MAKPVYVDGKRFSSGQQAAHWLGVDKSNISRAAKYGWMVRGHYVRYADDEGDPMNYGDEKVQGLPRWQFDALTLELAFMKHLGLTRPTWTAEDADELEMWCHALMQGTRQMDAGQREAKTDECGVLVRFEDLPQIMNNIAVHACRLVLSGALRDRRTDD